MAGRDPGSSWLLSWHPSDCTVASILLLASTVAAVRWSASGSSLGGLLAVHGALLMGFVACVMWMVRRERMPWVQFLRPIVTIGVVFTLYVTLGQLGFAAMPYLADATLSQLDTWLCGVDPSLFMQRFQSAGWVEFFSVIYGAFIPYVYLSLILGCLGRPPIERDQFLTGWVFTYAISFLGYLLVPAHGPVMHHAGDFEATLRGGFFHGLVLNSVEACGGPHGAFPSLHIGASVYLCLFDLTTNRLRGLTYLPIVILIYGATVFLRYHYVVDLMAGTVIAAVCVPLGKLVFLTWAERRQISGLPALPGGEADGLSVFSGSRAPRTSAVLSAH